MSASILLFFVGFISTAQDGNIPPPPSGPDPPGAPIDGGIIILFLVALIYGIYKTYKNSKSVA
ncbi:hypothetical protein FBALC1_16747 [Flavobacteriales bacterium ALC-1]|nr:hypothetical protein FBALC1_16747 [Flavobacteriales bacterium ALC-1]